MIYENKCANREDLVRKKEINNEVEGKEKGERPKEENVIVKDYYEAESWQFSGCGD